MNYAGILGPLDNFKTVHDYLDIEYENAYDVTAYLFGMLNCPMYNIDDDIVQSVIILKTDPHMARLQQRLRLIDARVQKIEGATNRMMNMLTNIDKHIKMLPADAQADPSASPSACAPASPSACAQATRPAPRLSPSRMMQHAEHVSLRVAAQHAAAHAAQHPQCTPPSVPYVAAQHPLPAQHAAKKN